VLVSVGFLVAFLVTADAAPVPVPPGLESLSWLPPNTVAISGAPRDQVSLLKWLRATPKTFPGMAAKPLPGCWDRVTRPIIASYQVWRGEPDDEAAVLVQGAVDRVRAESCIAETVRMLRASVRTLPDSPRNPGLSLKTSRTGAITRFDAERFGRTYVGWTESWVVWHPKRERVEELLAASRNQGTISPVLKSAIARSDRSAVLWGADTRDYSSVFTDVPSRSWTLSIAWAGSSLLTRVSFEYASTDDAKRAAAAVTAASADTALPAELRALARDARPAVRDRFVDLQLDAMIMADDKTLPALQTWLEKKRAASAKP
jgi:hypothetical protein